MVSTADFVQMFVAVVDRTRDAIKDHFRVLLEEKHLYQSIDVPMPTEIALLAKKANRDKLEDSLVNYFDGPWHLHHPATPAPQDPDFKSLGFFSAPIPFIKTHCTECKAVYPFSPMSAIDQFRADPTQGVPLMNSIGQVVQTFALTFLCQGCRRLPEVFLVRRVGPKLTLSGRAPIEHVNVPKVIPEAAKVYVSGGIVAHQSRQTLAGLFLLRTSIEQWIRSLGAKHEKADQAIEWYMSTLPDDFKSWVPSLREIYGALSEAIHKADGSAELFEKTNADIERHFDARRVRGLPDPKAPI
jgi:hypothetical protein